MVEEPAVGIVGHGIITVHGDLREQIEILREGFRFQANTVEGARLFRRRGAFLGTSRMTLRAELLRSIRTVPDAIEIQAVVNLLTLAKVIEGYLIMPVASTAIRLIIQNVARHALYTTVR